MTTRYRVKPGCTFTAHGHVVGRSGDVVEIDLDIEGNREIVEDQADSLQLLGDAPDYRDRAMYSRRGRDL